MVRLAQGRLSEAQALIDASVQQYEAEEPDPHQHARHGFGAPGCWRQRETERRPGRMPSGRRLATRSWAISRRGATPSSSGWHTPDTLL
jgi:hypothetical protein